MSGKDISELKPNRLVTIDIYPLGTEPFLVIEIRKTFQRMPAEIVRMVLSPEMAVELAHSLTECACLVTKQSPKLH